MPNNFAVHHSNSYICSINIETVFQFVKILIGVFDVNITLVSFALRFPAGCWSAAGLLW